MTASYKLFLAFSRPATSSHLTLGLTDTIALSKLAFNLDDSSPSVYLILLYYP